MFPILVSATDQTVKRVQTKTPISHIMVSSLKNLVYSVITEYYPNIFPGFSLKK